jgi:hypothetical protein
MIWRLNPHPEREMNETALNLDDLNVESFDTTMESDSIVIDDGRCTGCDSGCGIFGP